MTSRDDFGVGTDVPLDERIGTFIFGFRVGGGFGRLVERSALTENRVTIRCRER